VLEERVRAARVAEGGERPDLREVARREAAELEMRILSDDVRGIPLGRNRERGLGLSAGTSDSPACSTSTRSSRNDSETSASVAVRRTPE